MCNQLHHKCKMCKRDYICNEPSWICPTVNFDENAEVCPECEEEYWKLLMLIDEEHGN